MIALGKAHTRSSPSLSNLHKVALETVPMFVWLNTDRCRPQRVEIRPLLFSTPLFFRRSALWYSGLSMFRKFLKPRSTSTLPSWRPDVIFAVLSSLTACSFPLTPACPGQQIHRSLCSRILCMDVYQSQQPIPDSTFCMRFTEFVIMMACVLSASRWKASHCIACVIASTPMVRLEVVTLWVPLSSCTVLPPCLTVNCQTDRSLVTEQSV